MSGELSEDIYRNEVSSRFRMISSTCPPEAVHRAVCASVILMNGEDVDSNNNTVSFGRKKTGVPVRVHLGAEALNLFKDQPAESPLCP